ncbi:MAG: hypothetical protein LQ351_007674 [Letrouitia transgressa]|nr:MAG: hypothetical protein LQ351_007674 [Letrouitia transgressa]
MTYLFAYLLLLHLAPVFALGPQPPKTRPGDVVTFEPQEAGVLDGAAFMDWIHSQSSAGSKAVALREGSYHVTPGSDYAHIFLDNLHSLTLWMDSVNLTMTRVGLPAFEIYRCSDLVTYGPTAWWDTPGFSQATITDVSKTGDQAYNVQFHLDDGYDSSFLLKSGQVSGEYTNPKTGRLEAGPGWSIISGSATAVDGKENTYTVPITDIYFTPQVGYKMLARGDFIFCNKVGESNNTIINDYTLLNCAGFTWISSANRKTTFNSYVVKPAPFPPPGGTELPARSSSADGVHSSGDYVGPTFDSCFFAALDDDCMAVHGSLYTITSAGSAANSFITTTGAASPGDILRFYANTTYTVLGTGTVTSATSSSDTLTITVDNLPPQISDLVHTVWTNQMRSGSGFAVINTHTTGNRGRGAIIKASDGLIANNLFEGVTYGALDLGPEFSDWGEGDYVHNISMTNNTVRECNYVNKAAAAVMVHGDGDNDVHGNSNITISGLTIEGTTASNLYIGATEGLRVGGVRFVDAFREEYELWESWPGAVATFENVAFEAVTGKVEIVGGIGKDGIEAAKAIGDVTELEGGVESLVTVTPDNDATER